MINLIPLGEVPAAVLKALVVPVRDTFSQLTGVDAPLPLPDESRDPQRDQYLADVILDLMPSPRPGDRFLGIVDVDIYTFGLNYIFGLADMRTKKALISLARLKQEYYSYPEDIRLFQERTLKEAVHELGHTYGLKHCPSRYCVMHFSNSLQDTDYKNWTLCPVCLRKINRLCKISI